MKTLVIEYLAILPLLFQVPLICAADESTPPAELLWQNSGEAIDLMLRLDHWQEGLEGFNVCRRVLSADGTEGKWLLLNEVEPLTPYAATDKDLSNIEVDPVELEKLEDFNKEQAGKVLKATKKEQGWEEMLKPDSRQLKMLNYHVRKDYRLAKLIGLGLTDRQLPELGQSEKLEYALFAVRKGEQAEIVHRVIATPGKSADWPTDFHFNAERRKFAKDSMLKFSWLPEQIKNHGVTGFTTFYRPKGSEDEFKPTSEFVHPTPSKGEHMTFHKWESEEHEYEYALACVNAFGSHGPFIPEGTSTDKFSLEEGPPIAGGIKLTNHYSKDFTIAALREPDTKLRTGKIEQKANGIGTIVTTFQIHDREGKTYLVISHAANLEKVDLKCLVKTFTQREPLIPIDKMTTKLKNGKLYQFAELTLKEDDKFAVVTEVWTK